MRCIEILLYPLLFLENSSINRNMRCIEILPVSFYNTQGTKINRNMRCIEISNVYANYLDGVD